MVMRDECVNWTARGVVRSRRAQVRDDTYCDVRTSLSALLARDSDYKRPILQNFDAYLVVSLQQTVKLNYSFTLISYYGTAAGVNFIGVR